MEFCTIDPDNLQPPPSLADALSREQREAATHLTRENRGIAWWRVGDGKTRIALAWMFFAVPEPRPMVICSPGAVRQWEDEIRLLGLEGVVKPLFLSYGLLSARSRPGGRELVIDFKKFNCLIVDELWLFKNYKSRRSIMVRDLAIRVPTIGLSGSMVTARNIEDLYGQAKAVGIEKKIAGSMTEFRQLYCNEILNHAGFIERVPKRRAVEQIREKLKDNVHVHFPKETRDIREIDIRVDSTHAQRKIRNELVKTYYYEHHHDKLGFQLEIRSAASLLVKLQQISDGIVRDGEGALLRIETRKLDRLREMLSELLDAGERVLVWTAFRATATLLAESLPFPTLLLSGQHAFDADGWARREADVVVATVGSGASLNDFADCRYALFYSLRFSALQVQQAKGRILRASSSAGARYFYHLQTDGFPDGEVLAMIRRSYSTEEFVMMAMSHVITEAGL